MKKIIAAVFLLLLIQTASASSETADDLFDGVLRDHVKMGFVDYSAISRDKRFGDYLKYLAEAGPESFPSREAKLAFWINGYNALVIKGILDGLSPDGFFARIGFFKTADYRLAGREINLYDLERDIIIPLGEPRIHFAIVCASTSCPELKSEIYRAEILDKQLEDAARQFINDGSKNNFNIKLKIANLSKIFDWFPKDFENHSGSVANYVRAYADNLDVVNILADSDLYIQYLDYDWSLNGKPVN